jgi:hypothetical protein
MGARRAVLHGFALVGLAAIVVAGVWLWGLRPWRTAVSVNGRILTARELDLRAQTLLDDAQRVEHVVFSPARAAEALRHYRRQAVKMWILKEVLLAEAVARGIEVGAEDENESLKQMERDLKSRNLTVEQYFKEGPLPEEVKRRDFREVLLVRKFTTKEVADKISLTTKEIDDYVTELKRQSLLQTKPGEKPKIKTDRKTAIDMLRADRYRKGFRALFRSLYPKADIHVPEYPDLETLNAVSAPREEDKGPALPNIEPQKAKESR